MPRELRNRDPQDPDPQPTEGEAMAGIVARNIAALLTRARAEERAKTAQDRGGLDRVERGGHPCQIGGLHQHVFRIRSVTGYIGAGVNPVADRDTGRGRPERLDHAGHVPAGDHRKPIADRLLQISRPNLPIDRIPPECPAVPVPFRLHHDSGAGLRQKSSGISVLPS
jgi:hypothetical protein